MLMCWKITPEKLEFLKKKLSEFEKRTKEKAIELNKKLVKKSSFNGA